MTIRHKKEDVGGLEVPAFKGLMITHQGAEDIAVSEIEYLIGAKASTAKMCAIFKTDSLLDLAELAYRSQSATKVLALFDTIKVEAGFDKASTALIKSFNGIDISAWIKEGTRYKVECRREGTHEFSSQSIAESLGERLGTRVREELKFEPSADLKKPDLIFYVFIVDNDAYLGIDMTGIDLSKRDYKVMSHMPSIKGTMGFCLLMAAGYESKDKMMDVTSYSGVVPIEAAMRASGRSVNYFRKRDLHFQRFKPLDRTDFNAYFEKLDNKESGEIKGSIHCAARENKNLAAAKANAKIAVVHKYIEFSRQDVEWLDTKLDKNSLTLIASNSPRISKVNEAFIAKHYKELFYQAEYILKKNGRVALLCNTLSLIKDIAKEKGFDCTHERSIWQGDEELKIGVFSKSAAK